MFILDRLEAVKSVAVSARTDAALLREVTRQRVLTLRLQRAEAEVVRLRAELTRARSLQIRAIAARAGTGFSS